MLAPSVTTTLDEFLAHVERFGMGASESRLAELTAIATRSGVAPAVVTVMNDLAEPMVVRERALARVLADLRAMAPRLAPIAA